MHGDVCHTMGNNTSTPTPRKDNTKKSTKSKVTSQKSSPRSHDKSSRKSTSSSPRSSGVKRSEEYHDETSLHNYTTPEIDNDITDGHDEMTPKHDDTNSEHDDTNSEHDETTPEIANAATCLKDCDKVVTALKEKMKDASDKHQDLYKGMLSVMVSIAQNHNDIEKYHNEYLGKIHQIEEALKQAAKLADILHKDTPLSVTALPTDNHHTDDEDGDAEK